ncbi:APC family permease [Acidisoma cellulosilytica]|uniref:APC family permease n=1 Tax=Acidisoma cellulosilyticum TaxID=2802395 RepID=A0A963YY07_9PROT|nr:APC family permease [Acidisoma cellulosilyticum]MCB8879276.1 APC family permease [Acidisoma cellulosilyticum]
MALRRNLGLVEVIGLSLSMIAPTTAMAFNVTLTAGAAGVAAPLAFALSIPGLIIVGLCFVAFARRVASAGSAYAYIRQEFGARAGFLAGWALLLTYLTFGTGIAVLVGSFLDAALGNYHLGLPHFWILHGTLAILLGIAFAYRDMKLATRLMLALEGISVLAIIVLGILVLVSVGKTTGLPITPFLPDHHFGWAGIGYALVFAVLSFAGFESATTLGEEAANPARAIPIAVIATVIGAGIFYVFAAYTQVIGFGLDNMKGLANAAAPLNTLALKYGSRDFATVLDLATAISAFSCVLACVSSAARLLFSLGRAGLAPALGVVNPTYGTPSRAVLAVGAVMLAGALILAPQIGANDYYGDMGTIGVLALILVYVGVAAAAGRYAWQRKSLVWASFGLLGTIFMLWPLYNSIYPVPAFPGNLWPYLVIAYLLLGLGILACRPGLGRYVLETE